MTKSQKKRSILIKFRNYFFAGVVVLVPLGITLYFTLFLINISSKILPKELNPNHPDLIHIFEKMWIRIPKKKHWSGVSEIQNASKK